MQDTEKLINILHTGFVISMAITIVFLLITVLLFFVFDIRQVFMIRSGKAAKRDIRKLEEENFKTGRLSDSPAGQRFNTSSFSGPLTGGFDSQKLAEKEQKAPQIVPPQRPQDNATTLLGQNETTLLNGESTTVLDTGATTVLNEGATTVLNAGATTVLNSGMQNLNPGQNRMFNILKKEVHIHTDEVI